MLRGDLSNEAPRRWLVTLDTLLADGARVGRKSLFHKVAVPPMSDRAVSLCWQLSTKYSATMELVVFEQDDKFCAQLQAFLDARYTHPFPYVTSYPDWKHLQHSLAFRPDVLYVVDIAENMLRWGSRGTTLVQLWQHGGVR